MIFDWDVHHGNGTNDIFHASDQVLFVSVHQSPLYPGTGPAEDLGSGAGLGYTVNLPVPAGSGDAAYRSLVDHVVVPLVRAFSPQLLLVSAGYDAHREDPLAECAGHRGRLRGHDRSVCGASASPCGVPFGFVLEGGYALGALARSVAATMEASVADQPPGEEPAPVTSAGAGSAGAASGVLGAVAAERGAGRVPGTPGRARSAGAPNFEPNRRAGRWGGSLFVIAANFGTSSGARDDGSGRFVRPVGA